MKTSEFIKRFNELDTFYDIRAVKEEVFAHGVEINKFGSVKYETVARLPEDSNSWDFYGGLHFSPEMLELMAEIAKTPPEEREDDNRYVILNGKPFLFDGSLSTRLFLINEGNLSFCTASIDDLVDFSYTKEELEQMKATLPKTLQYAVELLTVTVGEAKKEMMDKDDDRKRGNQS